MLDLVSIIIPAYNVKEYLGQCVESALKQSYENLEIILVDDGSTDGSEKICDKYLSVDTRVKVIHQSNQGLSAARNAGLNILTGKYLMFLDGDDYLPEKAVEILMGIMKKEDADVVEGQMVCHGVVNTDIKKEVRVLEGIEALELDLPRTTAPGKLYATSIWHNKRFREKIIHEDYDIMYKILYEVKRYVYTESIVYYINERMGSITRSSFSEKNLILLDLDVEKISYFRARQNKILLEHAYIDYYNHLLDFYMKTKKRYIIQRYRKDYRNFMKLETIGNKTKVRLTICYFFPIVWSI